MAGHSPPSAQAFGAWQPRRLPSAPRKGGRTGRWGGGGGRLLDHRGDGGAVAVAADADADADADRRDAADAAARPVANAIFTAAAAGTTTATTTTTTTTRTTTAAAA